MGYQRPRAVQQSNYIYSRMKKCPFVRRAVTLESGRRPPRAYKSPQVHITSS